MQPHTSTIFFPQQYSERWFTSTIIENGILLLFQQQTENIYLNNLPISGFIIEPWLTHILISEVRGVIYKEK